MIGETAKKAGKEGRARAWQHLLWDTLAESDVADLANFGLTAILCRPLLVVVMGG